MFFILGIICTLVIYQFTTLNFLYILAKRYVSRKINTSYDDILNQMYILPLIDITNQVAVMETPQS